jgi:aminoglycoside 3-N-acetyltransferase I
MGCAIRELNRTDAPHAQRLVQKFHSRSLSEEYLTSLLGNAANLLLVAEDSNQLVGFLYAHWIDRLPEERSQLFIYEVEVAAEHQRTGVGSMLLADALERARTRGVRAFVLTNRSNLAAMALYRKLGGVEKNGDDLLFVFSSNGA